MAITRLGVGGSWAAYSLLSASVIDLLTIVSEQLRVTHVSTEVLRVPGMTNETLQ